MDFAAVPDRPDPADDNRSGNHLEATDHEGAAVPAALAEAVGLEHSAEAWNEDVADQHEAGPRYWVDVVVAAHFSNF